MCTAECNCPARRRTHRTPSAAARSAAWPRTLAGSARRCATSWGQEGGRLRAAGRWARAGRRTARPGLQRPAPGAAGRRGGMSGGRPAAPPGGEAGRGGTAAGRPTHGPSRSGRRSAGGRRNAGRPYRLIALGNRGRGARRPRRQPDVLPWRTPRARGGDRGRALERAAATRPSSSPARGSLGPHGQQITSPRDVYGAYPPQALSPCGSSSPSAPTARRLCVAGAAGR